MRPLHLMDKWAAVIGAKKMYMPLLEALAQYSLENPSPRVLAANLQDKEKKFPDMVGSWKVADKKGSEPKVGVVGLVAKSVAEPAAKRDADLRFASSIEALPGVLDELQKENPELLVLLLQGSTAEAKACAAKFPQ